MQIKTGHIKCSSCGAPLDLPEGTLKTRFKCPFCNVENYILNEDLTTGGLNHELSDAGIHKKLIEILSSSPFPPYDVFENTNVKKVNRLIIPVHWFLACTGMATFTYERGFKKEFNEIGFYDDDGEKHTYTRTDWTPMSAVVNDIRDYLVSANKQYNDVFRQLYGDVRNPEIGDAESLHFSDEAIDTKFDWSEAEVTGNTLKEMITETVEAKANESVKNISSRNENLDSVNIQKTESRVISIGIYEVILEYNGKEYTIYISHNGDAFTAEEIPFAEDLQAIVDEKTKEKDTVESSPKRTILLLAIIILISLGIMTIFAFVGLLFLLVAGILIIFYVPIEKECRARKKALEDAQNEINGKFAKIKEDFLNNKVALKGALSHVSGDPEAFLVEQMECEEPVA